MKAFKPMKNWDDVITNVNTIIDKLKTNKCYYHYEGMWSGIPIPEIREIQEFSIETRCNGTQVVCYSEKITGLKNNLEYLAASGFWEEWEGDLSYSKINAWFQKFRWEIL